MPRPRLVGRTREQVRALVLEEAARRCAWCGLPAEFVVPRVRVGPVMAHTWKTPSSLAAWCGRCEQDPARLAARALQGEQGMKSKSAKTAPAAERQTRLAALRALTAGVALPGGVEASVQAHQTGLFFVHVKVATYHGEDYTFPRLLADVTENESTVGLADGEHEMVFRGVRYESVMDAPPEIRAAAEGAFALLVPVLRGQ